jgi:hypothetical protein
MGASLCLSRAVLTNLLGFGDAFWLASDGSKTCHQHPGQVFVAQSIADMCLNGRPVDQPHPALHVLTGFSQMNFLSATIVRASFAPHISGTNHPVDQSRHIVLRQKQRLFKFKGSHAVALAFPQFDQDVVPA